jgi:tRNA A58 N-methylase Trm61
MSPYVFDNTAPQAARRITSLETLYDPGTIRLLEELGVGAGWQCPEVGGGSGSIAVRLARQVGPTGHVIVTALDPRYLIPVAELSYKHLTRQLRDIASDLLSEGAYDLIRAPGAHPCAAARRGAHKGRGRAQTRWMAGG